MTAPLRVLKFGGTSLGKPDRVERAASLIAREAQQGPLAVVVSAMGGTTDHLLDAADRASTGDFLGASLFLDTLRDLVLTNSGLVDAPLDLTAPIEALIGELRKLLYGVSLLHEHSPASLDLILSFGERLSATALPHVLARHGVDAMMVDARDLVRTDDRFGDALVDWDATAAQVHAAAASWGARIPVITGFLGRAPDGRTTTLGRNGSDYTATLLARGLSASEVQIWTDVPGVMTADPALVDEAWPLACLSYGEALELATFGARMFHPRTMIPLIASGIPMRIRHTMQPDVAGTLVDAHGADDLSRATSVTSLEGQALLDVQVRRLNHSTRLGASVQSILDAQGIPAWLTTQSAMGQAISAVIPIADVPRARAALEEAFATELARGDLHPIGVRAPVTLLTLVAEAMGKKPLVAGRLFGALGHVGVNVEAIGQSASSRSISCVIDASHTTTAVRAVHTAFNLTHQRISLLVLGAGVVGRELLDQLRDQRNELARAHDVAPLVVGIATSRKLLFNPGGISLDTWRAQLDAAPERSSPLTPSDLLSQLEGLTAPIVVDCTAADGMEDVYEAAFARGIHVVAANKKPLAIPQHRRDAVMQAARTHHRAWRYETTVGASLPVIETLKDLVRTGDRVALIEGSFSGTLGYLTNALMEGVPLHTAVRDAKAKGYTEPFPQDDLSGLDAARKALILARELGYTIELSAVQLAPLVPESLLEERSLSTFFDALEGHAPVMAAQVDAWKREGKVLRYLARIDPEAHERGEPLLSVGPMAVPAAHPAARLRGTESFVAFTTNRYQEYPLIVQGAGAGGAVTAAGVLTDVLRIAAGLRGR